MTIKASDLIALFRQAREERWGYIWGTRGQTWTQDKQDAATRDMTVSYGSKWIGRRVADCSGLFVWACKSLGGSIYHGSNTIYNKYTSDRGAVGGKLSIAPGTAVFMAKDGVRTHIGLYVGDGVVIEAQGTRTGVVESHLSAWDEWGELLVKIGGKMVKVDYDLPAEIIEIAPRTLRKGDSGTDVKELQEALLREGYDLGSYGADGKFGGETLSAVRAFQRANGLNPDGIVGPLTWAALRQTEDDEPDDEGEDKPQEAPHEPSGGEDELTLEQRVERLEKAVFGQEGGDSYGEHHQHPVGGT